MATVDQSSGINGGTHPSKAIRRNVPYKVETEVNIATITTTKGSALATADTVQILDIPGKSILYAAGLEMETVGDGGYTIDMGVSTVDADNNVDGVTWGSSISTGTITQQAAAYQPVVVGSDLTLDLKFTTISAVPTTGVFRAWAVIQDISTDRDAEEVDRDQLA